MASEARPTLISTIEIEIPACVDIYSIKRVSKAFSLVMKTNNCLRLRVLTWHTCPHLAYVSSPGIRVLGIRVFTWRTCPHLAYMAYVSSLAYMCPHLAYVSSPGIRVLTWCTCPHLAYVSSPGVHVLISNRCTGLSVPGTTSPSPSWVCAQKITCLSSCVQVH